MCVEPKFGNVQKIMKVIATQWLIINYCKVNKIDNTSPCYELLNLISFTFAAFWGHQEPLWRNLASDGRVGGKEELAVIWESDIFPFSIPRGALQNGKSKIETGLIKCFASVFHFNRIVP